MAAARATSPVSAILQRRRRKNRELFLDGDGGWVFPKAGKLADCCSSGAIDVEQLRSMGLGQA